VEGTKTPHSHCHGILAWYQLFDKQ
jgi:hypothetical protein